LRPESGHAHLARRGSEQAHSLLTPRARPWHHGCSRFFRKKGGKLMARRYRPSGAWRRGVALSAAAIFLLAPRAMAEEASKIDSGDTAWMLTSAALVLLMTAPGLALFYGGLVRSKNVLNLLMQSFIMMGLISIQWVLWGYSLAFGPDHGHVLGGLDWIGLRGVGGDPGPYAATIPHQT